MLGFFHIKLGENILGIEHKIVWATPGQFTVNNFPCNANGKNCGPAAQRYVDPSRNLKAWKELLLRRQR